jgi:metal-responsive CopG/Arc/MetJ family transcriptional regulator
MIDFSLYESMDVMDKQLINIHLAKYSMKKLDEYVIANKLRSRKRLIELIVNKWISENVEGNGNGKHNIRI